jgi:hypothetical protein
MHSLSLFYWVITPLHGLDASAAHHQEVECIYVANGTCYTSELTVSRPGPMTVNSRTSFTHFSIQLKIKLDALITCSPELKIRIEQSNNLSRKHA